MFIQVGVDHDGLPLFRSEQGIEFQETGLALLGCPYDVVVFSSIFHLTTMTSNCARELVARLRFG